MLLQQFFKSTNRISWKISKNQVHDKLSKKRSIFDKQKIYEINAYGQFFKQKV